MLYFGTDRRWNQPRSVRDLIEVPEKLDLYVNDYKVHVFEIAWLTDEQLSLFRSDFGIVANYFVQKRRNKDYKPDDERIMEHVDEVLKLLSVMTGDDRFEELLYIDNEKGRVRSMCEVLDRAINEGISQGISQGESMLGLLITKLFADGRTDDVQLAASDEEARKRFYKEYGIID